MNPIKRKAVPASFALVGAVILSLVSGGFVPSAAQAAPPPPYTVDVNGITLTDGSTFQDNGHVNVEVEGMANHLNFHFESKCTATQANAGDRPECFQDEDSRPGVTITKHDMAQFIGQTNIPWSAFGLTAPFCITWVQISHLNAHFGVDFGTKFCSTNVAQCSTDVPHPEYKYSQVIKGKDGTFHTEWRFQTRTVTYGEVEHKYIKSTYDFVDGGTTTVNGHTVSGHWVSGQPLAWRAIPDSVINAVWGASGIPANLIGGSEANPKGNVNINVYGGPNASVQYYAATEQNPSNYTAWGPWSGWSTTNPGVNIDTMQVETRQQSDNNSTPDKTVYYLPGGGQSDTNTAANWTIEVPGSPWTQIDQRTVTQKVIGPCPSDATASVVVDQQETCLTSSTVKAVLVNATLDAPLDQSVGTHNTGVTALAGHNFGNGTANDSVTYTVNAADPSLCPKSASASASVDSLATCKVNSTVLFTLAHADWETAADLTVGTHDRWAKAATGFLFPDGSNRLKVSYTVTMADPSLCPTDAIATFKVVTVESCGAKSTAKIVLVNATVDPTALPLPTEPGNYKVPVIADQFHLFANGKTTDVVPFQIKAKLTGTVCDQLAWTGSNPWPIFGGALAILVAGIYLASRKPGKHRA